MRGLKEAILKLLKKEPDNEMGVYQRLVDSDYPYLVDLSDVHKAISSLHQEMMIDKTTVRKSVKVWTTCEPNRKPSQTQAQTQTQTLTAALVKQTAHRIHGDGRYGEYKVFIGDVWEKLKIGSLADFKKWLLGANRRGEIRLARADLVAAMPPGKVSQSEITDQYSTFHFIVDE